jgi:hypothetical protein
MEILGDLEWGIDYRGLNRVLAPTGNWISDPGVPHVDAIGFI